MDKCMYYGDYTHIYYATSIYRIFTVLYIKERDTVMLDLLDNIFDPVMPPIFQTLQATRHGGIAKVVAQVVKWHSGP